MAPRGIQGKTVVGRRLHSESIKRQSNVDFVHFFDADVELTQVAGNCLPTRIFANEGLLLALSDSWVNRRIKHDHRGIERSRRQGGSLAQMKIRPSVRIRRRHRSRHEPFHRRQSELPYLPLVLPKFFSYREYQKLSRQ